MFTLNGKSINIDTAQTIDGRQYPAGVLRRNPALRASLGIVEVTPQPRPDERWYFVTSNRDGTFTATPKKAKDVKQLVLDQVNADFDAAMHDYAKEYPEYEQKTWEQQRTQSAAWVAWDDAGRVGPEPATPMLDGIASARGVDREELIRRANGKSQLFKAISAGAIGRRQALEDQILAIPDEADAIDTVLPTISFADTPQT